MAKITHKIKASLTFKLNNEFFAVNVSRVLSILEMKRIIEVPESPPYMKGVINLRGEVVPIIDSHVKFGLDPMRISLKTSILILEIDLPDDDPVKLGLLVDQVEEVIEIEDYKVIPPPKIRAGYRSKYITGMYETPKGDVLMLLDIDKVLTLEEITPLRDQEANAGLSEEKYGYRFR